MAEFPELIVHIGAGKAGSTALQFTLLRNMPALAEAGLAYLGLALEEVPGATRFDWCERDRPQMFFSSGPDDYVDTQILATLRQELQRLGAQGVRQVVWSNEAFLVQKWRILRVLRQLAADGVRIRPVVYVRRHDKRAVSAFLEFEIKSKRHRDGLHAFPQWLDKAAGVLSYADHLQVWMQHFPATEIYNFETIGDVAQHFCRDLLGIDGLTTERANETRAPGLMTAWTIFSGSRPFPTWAAAFRRLAGPLLILHGHLRPVPKPQELMPSAADITAVQDRFAEDLDKINALLAAQGQPPMAFDPVNPPDLRASDWELQQMLFNMSFALQDQVLSLKDELAELRARLDKLDGQGGDKTGEGG